MNFWTIVSYLIAITGTGLSAYFDLKTTYIPDEITHSMMILGAVILFLRFSPITALTYLGIAAIIFAIGFIVYSLGQIGGGDVKLYTALALLIPTFNTVYKIPEPPYPPIISLFFTSAVLGVTFISLKYMVNILRDRHRINSFRNKFAIALFLSGITLIASFFIALLAPGVALILIPIALGMFVYPFKDDIMTLYVLEKKKISNLTEDDIIALDRLDPGVIEKLGLSIKRTYLPFELKKIKARAKKHKISYVPVYEHLPTFGIYIFLALIVTILVGDLMFFLFSSL